MSYMFTYDGSILCQICKIPFDIARIRTSDEDANAAWGSYGQDFVYWDDLQTCVDCYAEPRFDVQRNEQEFEHIAGPHCEHRRGYSGHRITAMEMRDVNRVQCLKRKHGWVAKPGDEDFEQDSELCFITGIGREGPTEISVEALEPVKHGVSETLVSNLGSDPEWPEEDPWALPMHPTCFQMFKKLSSEQLGKVDIDAIWKWRERLERKELTWDVKLNPDLVVVLGDWYKCEPGTEYLVADPMRVPGLQEVLLSCIVQQGKGCDVVFPARDGLGAGDPFTKLPTELRWMILETLSAKDVAHLRMVSRAFSQLPQSYFHQLLLNVMPWVWEIELLSSQTVDWHSLWCGLSRADGGSCIDSKQRLLNYSDYEELSDELTSEIQNLADLYSLTKSSPPRPEEILNGLRNRRRIYPTIQEILSMPDYL